jgi:hypothetical protein
MIKTGDRVIIKGKNNYSIGAVSVTKICDSLDYKNLANYNSYHTIEPYYNIGPGTIIKISEYNTLIEFDNFGSYWVDSRNISNIITLCA